MDLAELSRYPVSVAVDLADANYLSMKARVTPGQQLIIPRAPTTLLAARADNPAPEPQMATARPAVPALPRPAAWRRDRRDDRI